MNNDFSNLQLAIVRRLKEDPILSGITVLAEDRKDLVNELERAMAELGLCIVVGTAKAGVSNANLQGPVFDRAGITVAVTENTLTNRTPAGLQYDAFFIAVKVAQALHFWRPDEAAWQNKTLIIKEGDDSITEAQSEDLLAYDIHFTIG